MLPDEIEVLLREELALNQALDRLVGGVLKQESPEDSRKALLRIASEHPDDPMQGVEAMIYYRGMRTALNEDDFRWGTFLDLPPSERWRIRKTRLAQYNKYLQLFELEIKLGRTLRHSSIALGSDWSSLDLDLAEQIQIMGHRLALRFAALLFRLSIPGGLDYCDSAAFRLFRMVYLRPPPTPAA
jgi:hypothetical protein